MALVTRLRRRLWAVVTRRMQLKLFAWQSLALASHLVRHAVDDQAEVALVDNAGIISEQVPHTCATFCPKS